MREREALKRAGGGGSASGGPGDQEGMGPALIGGVVIGVSLAVATIFCLGLCLALWYKRLRGQAGDPSPATFLVSKRKPDQYAAPDHPMAFVMPTITASEAGSEPQTPTPTLILTPTERSKAIVKAGSSSTLSQTRSNPSNPEDHPNVQRWDALANISSTPPPAYSPPPPLCRSHGFCVSPPTYTPLYANSRPRSASPKGLLKSSQRNPPLSLPLPGNRWTPRALQRPRSASPKVLHKSPGTPPAIPPRALASGTPPALPPRSIFLRRTAGGVEEVRGPLQPFYFDEEGTRSSPDLADIATPDSVDGWGPTWTPASSIASGGGCGLGELKVRLRYAMRTRLLRLTVLSADNLPLRLGPEPVDTYTKAVLLPDKRVRFSTRTVPALRNAHFNASFTHASRPARLAHSTLRFSVCQITACGRRVVLGYAAIPLASAGLRAGLNHDLDTGSLTLHLEESAPDQQVGMGGHLQIGLSWDGDAHELTISILHLTGLQYDQHTVSQEVQVYIKVTVYTNNTILCWRRTTPCTIEAEVTLFEEELILRMPELDLDATHLVLSAREKTGPGCGRRVLGSCVVGRGSCVGEDGRHHWLDMLRAAPDIVVRTHPLAALAQFQNPGVHDNPPAYQNVFPGPPLKDLDIHAYHRYENIGLLSSQNYPVIEIPGPKESQNRNVDLQRQPKEQDTPSSSDECHSSEIASPDPCQSPELGIDESQDTELSSIIDSLHSELVLSNQSHYSEIVTPDQLPDQDISPQDQSLETLLSQQKQDVKVSSTNVSSTSDTEDRKEEEVAEKNQSLDPATENIYYNQPLIRKRSIQTDYDTPKSPSEPIYAKPDLTLKRSNNSKQQTSSDFYANQRETSQDSYQSSDTPTEPIYESPNLSLQRAYDKPESPCRHIYDKPDISSQHVYQNCNLVPQNIYQVPDLSVPHGYQDPNMSPTHIYESPNLSPEHIYQMPYESSFRRYENVDAFTQDNKGEYQNVGVSHRKGQSRHTYENIPNEYEETSPHYANTANIKEQQYKAISVASSSAEEVKEVSICTEQYQTSSTQPRCSGQSCDTESESSEYHDARSYTQSFND